MILKNLQVTISHVVMVEAAPSKEEEESFPYPSEMYLKIAPNHEFAFAWGENTRILGS